MTENELKEHLSRLGTVEVFNNNYVFTLLFKSENASKQVLDVLYLVTQSIKDKPNTEVIKNEDDYILIVLKPI